MKTLTFASRNSKEIFRDPLNLLFSLGFPLILLFLLSAINANVPEALFEIEKITPGIAVFGLSFISLFSGMLISKDRETSFMARLFASPLNSSAFITGYIIPLLPMAVLQICVCFIAAFFLGMAITPGVIISVLILIPTALLYIGIGLLAGCLFNDKQVGGICGALLTNLSAWLSGTWFDLKLVGGAFEKIAYALPFVHAVDMGKASVSGNYPEIGKHMLIVLLYTAATMTAAIIIFKRKMKTV